MPDEPSKPLALDAIGIFQGLSYADYDALAGTSSHRLWTLYGETPKRFKWETDHPTEVTTQAMRDGQAIHAALLEPARFVDAYTVGGPINPRTGQPFGEETKAYSTWAAAQNKPCLSQSTYDLCKALSVAVHAHPFLGPLLRTMQTEVVIQWVHEESGLLLKGRLDALNVQAGIILDLKSCESASAQRFGHAAYKNGYLFQAAMYVEGFKAAAARPPKQYILAALEKTSPYDIQCFAVSDSWLDLGRAQVADALRQLVLCRRYDDWPGYPEGLQDLMPPGWAGQEWTPYADGLETLLKKRAMAAGRTVPTESVPDTDDGILGI
jgi:hypothetical protein